MEEKWIQEPTLPQARLWVWDLSSWISEASDG